MGLFGNNQQPAGTLNLGASSGQGMMQNQNPFSQNGMMQQPSHNPYMAGPMGGMGGGMQQQGMMGQQQSPPSEMEINMAMMKTLAPMDRFIVSNQMMVLVQMLNDLVSYSVLEVLKTATFSINEEEGAMKMDASSLPPNLQTMSAENITSQFNSLQMASQQNIQQAEMQQQQIAAFAQQSAMGGALSAAMSNDGFMDKVGSGAGNFMGKMIGSR